MRLGIGSSATSRARRLCVPASFLASACALAQPVPFDFDSAPLHASLPVDVTVSGITAHCSATAQGFSIQPADTLGFTPLGFGGCAIYPNSIYASDLLISFNLALSDFSIMYAPEELGCDTSATMRVTGYMDSTFAATSTTTAPIPGTWPVGTLTLSAPQGFNNVVVHYDARPACLDWGPIFMADNMVVTPLAVATPPDPIFANGFG